MSGQKEREKFQAAAALMAEWRKLYPAAFPADPKRIRPLAVGVHQTLIDAGYNPLLVRVALGGYMKRPAYLLALTRSQRRIDLNGNEAEEITEEQRKAAAARLRAVRQRLRNRSGAAVSAKPAAAPESP
jgi:sRNA-binding protein